MRQRITFLHKPEDAIDPNSVKVTSNSLALSRLKAAREDRITFSFDELPKELQFVLKQSHELHIRYVSNLSYESIPPLLSRVSPGLHVYYSPQRSNADYNLLCFFLDNVFSPKPGRHCINPEKSFTSLPTQRFHYSTAYEYYLPQSHYNNHALVDYMLENCPPKHLTCRKRVDQLRDADYIDFDFDTISHTVTMTSFWSSQVWDLYISNDDSKDRLEVGILSNEKPLEPEELNLGGFLTVVGEDTKPSPTLFAFPARHHPISTSYSATFLKPTGLHPNLQLQFSDSKPPIGPETCSLHAHLTLPGVIFADKYQLSDPLFLASKNLSAIHHITQPVDLEAPEYAMSLWGSTMLLELAPPDPSSSSKAQPWTAEIPLHLRYLPPTPSGYSQVSIPWPVVFWACTANEGTKFNINPFDRVNLGYDGLFGPRTMFYHLSPKGSSQGQGNGTDGYSVIDIPVLKLGYTGFVEVGTAAVILLGFGWVMWKLLLVWRMEGYGRYKDLKDNKKRQ